MSKKGFNATINMARRDDPPMNLKDHIFYGLQLDEEQLKFRDAIYSKDYDVIFCESPAGTGKTLVSVATGMLMCEMGIYDGIVYIVSPTQEERIGFLPGDIQSKTSIYSEPIYDALLSLGYSPECVISSTDSLESMKESGGAVIRCVPHTYMRGINFSKKFVIIEEAQNMYFDDMRKVLTRCHDDCKVVVIGNAIQCDIYKHPERSGFVPYLNRFSEEDRCFNCELKTNHRGWISTVADNFRMPES